MSYNLRNRHFLALRDFSPQEIGFLLKLSADLKTAKYAGTEVPRLTGKEIALKFNSALQSKGTFYTDSNGREMVKRQRDARGPSYPPYVVGEPVAGNYYPVNSMISLDDSKTEMAVVVDTTMGGSSMSDGSLEVVSDAATPAPRSRAHAVHSTRQRVYPSQLL